MNKTAILYRMVTPDHLCPWGIKAKDLLRRNGYHVEDHHLTTKAENEAYKREDGYDETPQIMINGTLVFISTFDVRPGGRAQESGCGSQEKGGRRGDEPGERRTSNIER